MQNEGSHTAADLGIDLSDLLAGIDTEGLLQAAATSNRGVGKAELALSGHVSRELTQEDIDKVGTAMVGVSTAPPLKSLRDRHHQAAQLLAKGFPETQVAQITGYSISRISILKADPSFNDLLSHYRTQQQEIFIDTVKKMKALTDDTVELLAERIEQTPDSVTTTQLIEIVKTVGDRAGYAPIQKQLNMTIPMDSERIAAIKGRAAARQIGNVKRITQEAINGEYQTVKEIDQAPVGEDGRSARPIQEAPETQGLESEGYDLRAIDRTTTQGEDS